MKYKVGDKVVVNQKGEEACGEEIKEGTLVEITEVVWGWYRVGPVDVGLFNEDELDSLPSKQIEGVVKAFEDSARAQFEIFLKKEAAEFRKELEGTL